MMSCCRLWVPANAHLARFARIACGLSCLALPCAAPLRAAPFDVLAAQYRADVPFPEFESFWHKAATPAGGCLHLYLHNTNRQPVIIQDVLLEGISLTQAIAESTQRKFKKHLYASSIYFSHLTPQERQRLIDLGEPIWWRVDPKAVPPDAVAEVLVRLRCAPPARPLNCRLRLADGTVQEVMAPTVNVPDRCADVCFSPGLDTAWAYFTARRDGAAPKHILLDGHDVTAACKIGSDPRMRLAPVVLKPSNAFALASLHCFQAVYEDDSTAIATARAFPEEFVYGLWGARRGPAGNPSIGRAFVQEIAAHNVNLQMPGIGSQAVAAFYRSDEGRALLERLGVRRVVDSEGKGGARQPYAYYLADEPDAADSRVPGVPGGYQVGCLAQGLAGWSEELRREDAVTPHMLNLDYTFTPDNWRIYGQLPDICAADPYYQPRLREAYAKFPDRVRLFSKATYVFAESAICKSASEPRPLHIMLYGNRYQKGTNTFRGPTPAEKRIEAFYAIAAGAKGLSYWWYLPFKPAVGLGAAEPGARALWREVGLIGAELRTAGPLIARSSPLPLEVSHPPKLWARALAVGLDAVILVVVNDDYTNDRQGTTINPVANADLSLTTPAWLDAQDTFEILSTGTEPLAHKSVGNRLELDLGTVNVTRLLVIANDPALRQAIQDDYAAHYAANVRALQAR